MKKVLVASLLAAATGAALAQSTVTLSGMLKSGIATTRYSNGATGNGSGQAVADGASRFIIGGTEDLGGGLQALFQIDTRFRVDDNGAAPTASPLATGNTFVGLAGSFGAVTLGKRDTHYCYGADSHIARATALQASSCGLLGFVGTTSIANTLRASNTLRYDLPAMASWSGYVSYSTAWATSGSEGAVGDAGKGGATAAQLTYAPGAFRIGVSVWNARNEPETSGQKAYTVAGGYNFGVVNVGLTYDQSRLTVAGGNDTKRSVWSIPVTVPVGAGTVLFTYTRAGDSRVGSATAANTGASLWSLAYDHALSKRTSVGVSYASLNNRAAAAYNLYTQLSLAGHAATVAGQDAKQLYVGMRHLF